MVVERTSTDKTSTEIVWIIHIAADNFDCLSGLLQITMLRLKEVCDGTVRELRIDETDHYLSRYGECESPSVQWRDPIMSDTEVGNEEPVEGRPRIGNIRL